MGRLDASNWTHGGIKNGASSVSVNLFSVLGFTKPSEVNNSLGTLSAQQINAQVNSAGTSSSAASAGTTNLSGQLNYSQLEQLWVQAGGNPAYKAIAAAIAMAESGGQQYATDNDSNGTQDRGYWQINSSHGSLSTFDPLGNARAAISISSNGSNWTPWTTYTSGAYLQYLTAGQASSSTAKTGTTSKASSLTAMTGTTSSATGVST